jgi:type III secretion protein R
MRYLWLILIALCLSTPLLAENGQALTSPFLGADAEGGGQYPDFISQSIVLISLALAPFIIMLLTSFMKMVITLALLRSALGTQQTPPNQVLNGIALILTFYVMYPTGMQMYKNAEHILKGDLPTTLVSADSASKAIEVFMVAKEPLRDFLLRNSSKKQIDGFLNLAEKTFPVEVRSSIRPTDFIIVIPAFIVSQLRSAFEIGVLIYIPFFVIDIVTSNILLAMQMMMLSPLSIALPLKLLLIVMVNGWTLILEGLVLSYN